MNNSKFIPITHWTTLNCYRFTCRLSHLTSNILGAFLTYAVVAICCFNFYALIVRLDVRFFCGKTNTKLIKNVFSNCIFSSCWQREMLPLFNQYWRILLFFYRCTFPVVLAIMWCNEIWTSVMLFINSIGMRCHCICKRNCQLASKYRRRTFSYAGLPVFIALAICFPRSQRIFILWMWNITMIVYPNIFYEIDLKHLDHAENVFLLYTIAGVGLLK